MQAAALQGQDNSPLPDAVTEGDEMFQNAGEKGTRHDASNDPPRRRANSRRGIGTMENDRPPIQGVVGRETGQIRLTVCDNTRQETIQPKVEAKTREGVTFHTDESSAYNRISDSGREHGTVCHSTCAEPVEASGNMQGTTMVMASARCIATPRRGFGRDCVISSGSSGEFTRNTSRSTSPCSNGRTTLSA